MIGMNRSSAPALSTHRALSLVVWKYCAFVHHQFSVLLTASTAAHSITKQHYRSDSRFTAPISSQIFQTESSDLLVTEHPHWGIMSGTFADQNRRLVDSHSTYSLWPSSGSIRMVKETPLQNPTRAKENRPIRSSQENYAALKCPPRILSPSPNRPRVLRTRPSMEAAKPPALSLTSSNINSNGKPEMTRRKSVHKRVMSKVKDGILNRSKSTIKLPEPLDVHRCMIDTMADKTSSKLHRTPSTVSRHSLAGGAWNRPAMQASRPSPLANLSMSMLDLDKSAYRPGKHASRSEVDVNGTNSYKDPSVRSPLPSTIRMLNSIPHRPQPVTPIVDPVFLEIIIRTTSRHIGPEDPFPT